MRTFRKVESSGSMLFDCNVAVCWQIEMVSHVDTPRIRNIIPGVLYTFIIHQDAKGGYKFTWPVQCENGTAVNPAPNSYTVQNFVGMYGGTMRADIPATYQ
jgi:hypothetical protein